MTPIAFTASRSMTAQHFYHKMGVEFVLDKLIAEGMDEAIVGGAPGGDWIIANYLVERGLVVHAIFPFTEKDDWMAQFPATYRDRGPEGKEPQRLRNRLIVDLGSKLVAFPMRPTFYRSGTWMTINIAREVGKQVDIWPLISMGGL